MTTNPNPSVRKNILAGLSVPTSVDPSLRLFLQAVKQHLELLQGNKGQPRSRAVTLDDLATAGIATVRTVRGRGEIVKIAEVTGAEASSAAAAILDELSELDDVVVYTAKDGQILVYDATSGKWMNEDPDLGYPSALGYAGM